MRVPPTRRAAASDGAGARGPGGAGVADQRLRAATAAVRASSFISQAALDQADCAVQGGAGASSRRSWRSAGAARRSPASTSSRHPMAAWSPACPVVLGDMAMPGRPLLTLYDPAALRVTAAVPQTAVAGLRGGSSRRRSRFPGCRSAALVKPAPRAAAAHGRRGHATRSSCASTCRPADGRRPACSPAPGCPAAARAARCDARSSCRAGRGAPRRDDAAVYVVGTRRQPLLRQVRLGPQRRRPGRGPQRRAAGERVALDPQAAARVR